MKREIFSKGYFLVFSMFLFFSVSAQEKTIDENVKATDVFEVRLPIVVTDKKKQFVSGLKQSDFIVLENKQIQEITFFSDEKTNPPVFVAVLMDTSGSTKVKMNFSKQAAKEFIFSVTRSSKDQAAFLTFNNEIRLRQDFTGKVDLLERAIENVNDFGGQTSLFDAVYSFSNEKMRGASGRRVMVIITDGEDTFSRVDLKDAIEMAQQTETVIYAVSTKGGFLGSVPGVEMGTGKDAGDKVLERMAAETGGEAFFTGDIVALENAFQKISAELRSQYLITYRPTNQEYDGKERKIEVRLADQSNAKTYKIRTKTKYRAVKNSLK